MPLANLITHKPSHPPARFAPELKTRITRTARSTKKPPRSPAHVPRPRKVVTLAYSPWSRHLDSSLEWLQTEYGLRGRDLHRRSRAGRGTGNGRAAKGRACWASSRENIFISRTLARGILCADFGLSVVPPPLRSTRGFTCSAPPSRGPLISKRLDEIAAETGARCPVPATAQPARATTSVRFELSAYALNPRDQGDQRPGAEVGPTSRTKLLEFAEQNQIPIARTSSGTRHPFSASMRTCLHTSSREKVLETRARKHPDYVYQRTVHPEDAPDAAQMVEISFERGDAVAINGEAMSPAHDPDRAERAGRQAWRGALTSRGKTASSAMKSRGIY